MPTHHLPFTIQLPSPEGLLLVNKPAGMTSHDVVDAIRKITKVKRVGHAGTLDPFATGLLLIGINRGTKMLTNLVGLDKTYEATARLGAVSTTDDLTGEIQMREARREKRDMRSEIREARSEMRDMRREMREEEKEFGIRNTEFRTNSDAPSPSHFIPSLQDIELALDRFRGGYVQTAPAYSAKKIGGKKMYTLARKGKLEGIELPKKEIRINDLALTLYAWPNLSFIVSCSSGTYIRSLARDIGETLGCGGYLTDLRRTRIGSFRVEDAVPLAELNREILDAKILPYQKIETL
jgi:tRNA pseudouridine55 synthase